MTGAPQVEPTDATGAALPEAPTAPTTDDVAPAAATATAAARADTGGLARAAGINSLGNVASRVLGVLRESVISSSFGATGATSAFDAISAVPRMVYELLVGGMLSAALVPVLSEYAADDDDDRHGELEDVLSILLSLAGAVLLAVTVFLAVAAPWVAPLLVGGFDDELLATATMLLRLIVPAILIYGISGILQAYHYARKAFVYPAMGGGAHNLGVIIAVILLARRFDIYSLSLGIVAASFCQLAMQIPGMRGVRLRLRLDWRHPVVRRILILYAPVVVSIVIQNVGIIIDRNLASRTSLEAITWMNKATFLIQLPLGLVSMAISLAVLPTLSQIDATRELDAFKRTFTRGLRLVLVVIIPAAAGLFVLGRPLIELIFEHGVFTAADTVQSWRALRIYLIGLPFAAIDLPLIFSFYAQKNTRTPVIVGIIAVSIYLVVGPTLAFVFDWGFLGLVAANAVQLTSHALIMLVVFSRKFEGLGGYGLERTTLQAVAAAVAVALVGFASHRLLAPYIPPSLIGRAALAGIPAGLAAGAYLAAARLLRIQEWELFWGMLARRLGR